MPGKGVAAEAPPVILHQPGHRASRDGDQVEPEKHRPQAVFFARVAGTGAETLFPAQVHQPLVQQVAEIAPPGGRLVGRDAEGLRHPVHRAAGGHGTGHAGEPLAVAGHLARMLGEQRQAVARRDDHAAAHNHVAIPVAVRGGAQVARVRTGHPGHEVGGVHGVGIGMDAAEIRQRLRIHHRLRRGAQPALQDLGRVGPGHGIHGVETHAKTAVGEQCADTVEIEQPFHQCRVIRDCIHHLDAQFARLLLARLVQRDLADIGQPVMLQPQGSAPHRLGQRFGRLAAVGGVEFHPEIALGAAGVVAGGEQETAGCAVQAYQVGGRGGGEQPVPADDDPGDAVARSNAEQHLQGFAVPEAAVTAGDQGGAREIPGGVEDGLEEVLEVVRLAEYPHFLAQPRRAWPLVVEGSGGDAAHFHDRLPRCSRVANFPVLYCRA